MVRPVATEENKRLGLDFALAVSANYPKLTEATVRLNDSSPVEVECRGRERQHCRKHARPLTTWALNPKTLNPKPHSLPSPSALRVIRSCC